MARGKRKVEDAEDTLTIRTTPRKRKQVEHAEISDGSEIDSPITTTDDSANSVKGIRTPIKSKGGSPKKPGLEVIGAEAGTINTSAVNGREAVIQAVPVRRPSGKGEIQTARETQVLDDSFPVSEDGQAETPKRKRKTKEDKEAAAMPLAARTPGLRMFVGAHTSIAKGVENAITNSVHIGGNAFACFLKSQRKWDNPAMKDENRDAFHQHLITYKYDASSHIVPHGSYLVNLASTDKELAKKSYDAFLDDLRRCEALGIKYYNFHPGAAGKAPMGEAIGRLAGNLNRALEETTTVVPLLENMATRGSIIGGRFQDLRDIIALIKPKFKSRIGVCIDTCHAFASGYDLRTPEAFDKTLSEFDQVVGMKYLKALHLNDSKAPFSSNKDLHQNIGLGFLGLRAFHSVMNEPRFQELPMILETPCEKPDPDDPAGKKVLEDKAVWAKEIKLLESLIGMDLEGLAFQELEKELSNKGKAERVTMQKQFDDKKEKDAKKLAKEREKGQPPRSKHCS